MCDSVICSKSPVRAAAGVMQFTPMSNFASSLPRDIGFPSLPAIDATFTIDRCSFLHHFFSFFSRLCSTRRLTANGKLKIFRVTSEEPLHRALSFLAAELESIDIHSIDTLLPAVPYSTLSDDVSRFKNAFDLHALDPAQDQLLAIRFLHKEWPQVFTLFSNHIAR